MLSTLEKSILKTLEDGPMHASGMALKLTIPRTSIAYTAKKLLKGGLVREKQEGRKVLYTLQNKRKKGELIEIHSGDTFYDAYRSLLSLPRHTTVYGVQGAEAGKASLDTIPVSLLTDVHAYFKRSGILMKTLSNRELLRSVSVSEELAESHKGRTLGARFLNDSLFLMGAEIYCTPALFIIANPVDRRAFVTRDINMCELMYQICSIFYESFQDLPSTNMDIWFDSKDRF